MIESWWLYKERKGHLTELCMCSLLRDRKEINVGLYQVVLITDFQNHKGVKMNLFSLSSILSAPYS